MGVEDAESEFLQLFGPSIDRGHRLPQALFAWPVSDSIRRPLSAYGGRPIVSPRAY